MSTLSTASVRPVNTSHSTISFLMGLAIVTGGGGGGGGGAGLLQPERASQRTRTKMPVNLLICRIACVISLLFNWRMLLCLCNTCQVVPLTFPQHRFNG